jgi:hypothetical protein
MSSDEAETIRVSIRARPFLGDEASLLPDDYDDVFIQDNLLYIRSRLEPAGYALATDQTAHLRWTHGHL